MVAQAFARDLLLLPGAALSSVSSQRPERAREFATCFRAARAHDTLDQLVRDDDVDVVYIATPHHLHRQHAVACLDAGKPVLCEKPFALNAAETGQIVEHARRSRRFCMEAMWTRFHPLVLKVRSMVQAGEIGTVRMLTAEFGHPTPYDPRSRFFDLGSGGGALLDRGVYPISLAYFLLGPPAEITGRASIGATGVDEQDAMVFTYSTGALAMLAASLRSHLRNEAVIVGTHGQIRIHEPLYAPHRVSIRRFEEPSARLPRTRSRRTTGRPGSSGTSSSAGYSTPSADPYWKTCGACPARSFTRPGKAISSRPRRSCAGSGVGSSKARSCPWRNRSPSPALPTFCADPGACAIPARAIEMGSQRSSPGVSNLPCSTTKSWQTSWRRRAR